MEEKKNFEAVFKEDLYQYLLGIDKVDAHLPEAPDLEELWQKVGESYLPDAIASLPNILRFHWVGSCM